MLRQAQCRGAFGSSRNAFTIGGFGLPTFNTSPDGVVGGGQAGYDWQTGPWVLGLEANFERSGLSGSRTAPACRLSAARLRRAYRRGSPGSGRCGHGSATRSATGSFTPPAAAPSARQARPRPPPTGASPPPTIAARRGTAGALGGGVEVALAGGWSAKIEYLYLDLGSRTTTYPLIPPISNTSRLSANVITAGVNYHF